MHSPLKDLCWETRVSTQRGREDRRLSWIVHGNKVSVEFWIQVGGATLNPRQFRGEACWVGGFEIHSREGEGEPDHKQCSILGVPCWHDGSSLSASRFFDCWGQGDEQALIECAIWVRSHEGPSYE